MEGRWTGKVTNSFGYFGKKGFEGKNGGLLFYGFGIDLVWLAFSLFFVCRKTHLVLKKKKKKKIKKKKKKWWVPPPGIKKTWPAQQNKK